MEQAVAVVALVLMAKVVVALVVVVTLSKLLQFPLALFITFKLVLLVEVAQQEWVALVVVRLGLAPQAVLKPFMLMVVLVDRLAQMEQAALVARTVALVVEQPLVQVVVVLREQQVHPRWVAVVVVLPALLQMALMPLAVLLV